MHDERYACYSGVRLFRFADRCRRHRPRRHCPDQDRGRRRTEAMLEIGRDLLEMKELLGHGQFLAWLHAEFGRIDRTAENYMQAARCFGDKPEIISHLPSK